MARHDFKRHNEPFICMKCGKKNPPAEKSERNHCRNCLFSLHVDEETPGDRKSACRGLMDPIKLDYKGGKGFMVWHRCQVCGKQIRNTLAEDDRKDQI